MSILESINIIGSKHSAHALCFVIMMDTFVTKRNAKFSAWPSRLSMYLPCFPFQMCLPLPLHWNFLVQKGCALCIPNFGSTSHFWDTPCPLFSFLPNLILPILPDQAQVWNFFLLGKLVIFKLHNVIIFMICFHLYFSYIPNWIVSFVKAGTLHYSSVYPYCAWNMPRFKVGYQ